MTKFASRIALGIALAIAYVGGVGAATGQSPNQVLTRQAVVDNVGIGVLAWKGAAQTGTLQVADYTWFTTFVTNSGSCNTGGNAAFYVMTFGDMVACKAAAIAQHTTAVGGTPTGLVFCNPTCLTGGGHSTAASPRTASFQVAQVDGTHAVSVANTVSSSCNFGGTYTLKDSAGTVEDSGSFVVSQVFSSATVTTGAVGTWTWTLAASGNTTYPSQPPSCQVTSTATSYF